MFIAVMLRYTLVKDVSENIAVWDTDDGSIEIVPYADVEKFGISVINSRAGGNHVSAVSICTVLPDEGSISFDGVILRYFEHMFIANDHNKVEYNGKEICLTRSELIYYLTYMFIFRNYIVMRFHKTGSSWFTVAVPIEDGVVTRWEYDSATKVSNFVCGSKSLMTRIDTLSEV